MYAAADIVPPGDLIHFYYGRQIHSVRTLRAPKSMKNAKMQLFFRFLQIVSKCQKMVPDDFRSVPWTRNTSFPSQNTPTIYQKKFLKTDFGALRSCFCLHTLEDACKNSIFEAYNSNFLALTMSPQNVSNEFEIF